MSKLVQFQGDWYDPQAIRVINVCEDTVEIFVEGRMDECFLYEFDTEAEAKEAAQTIAFSVNNA